MSIRKILKCGLGIVAAAWATHGAFADTVGIVYSRQLPQILSTLTGVSPLEQEIREYFDSNSSKLPSLGQVSEVTTSFFLTELSYSSLYCQRFVRAEEAQAVADRWALQSVDFAQPFSQFKDPVQMTGLLNGLAAQLWGRAASPDELSILQQELGDWVGDPDASDLKSLEPTLVALCSVYLSSPALWLEVQ